MRASFHALVLLALTGCGSATLGDPPDDVLIDAGDQDVVDARRIIDAPTPDARVCAGGDRRVQDPATGHCLIYVDLAATWAGARTACNGLGGELVAVGAQAENALVLSLPIDVVAQPDVWLGASDLATEGTFVWTSGDAMIYTNWRTGEPNNGGDSGTMEDCAVLEADTATGTWDDRPCTRSYPYVCELI